MTGDGDDLRHPVDPFRVISEAGTASYDNPRSPIVSVIIPTRDRAPFLDELFDALEHQTLGREDFEVIVVDDGSRDGTWGRLSKIVQTARLRILILRLDRSIGQGPGRNVGIERAQSEVISFIDDDCIPEPDWLEKLSSPFLESETSEKPSVVVQGRTVPWAGDDEGPGPWARTLWVLGPTWLFETCNIAYRRFDLRRAGGFPRRNDVPTAPSGKLIGEDALLGWRVVEAGARLFFRGDAVVYHRHHPASYIDWALERRGVAVFPRLMRMSPLARNALWAHWFLARRTAAFDLALAGSLFAVLRHEPKWLVGAIPWVWMALPEAAFRGGRHPAVRLAQLAVGDLVGFVSLVLGSARSGSVVL